MKQFNDTAILTTKNPEAFLNFTYDATDYLVIPDASIGDNILYVNGLDINNYVQNSAYYAIYLDATNNIASFHIFTDINYNFSTNLTFNFYSSEDDVSAGNVADTVDVSIFNKVYTLREGIVSTYNSENVLVDGEASYLLLRTNPKFTGNVKLVVDTSNNLFLDTFKVSELLSNKTYRKKVISANSVLSSDIRNNFSTLINTGALYSIDNDKTLVIDLPKLDYKDQYITTYNYGARILFDELYDQDNGLLAPLWINSKLPDYFAIFKLNGVYNADTYLYNPSLNTLASQYLQNSNIIKSWSLKPESNLGKYLTTHLADVVKIQAPVFLSLTNPIDPSINLSETDPNTWYGIAVDRGILTGRSEDPYFFNQKTDNFTDINAFISDGFSRQNLLCPNLINIEYVFSDSDASLYTMSRYFGLYLTENILYNIAYYSDTSGGNIEIISLDGKDSSVFMHSSVFDSSWGTIMSSYKNRIFVLNDQIQLQRIINVNQINGATFNSYVSKPYKNIFSVDVVKDNSINSFITLTLNNVLEQGEHLRVVNKTQNKIWEAYSTNASDYDCNVYCSISEDASGIYPTIYHTYFDINGDITYQVQEIEKAFNRFLEYDGTCFKSGNSGSNWASIILTDDADPTEEWMFQRIMATTLNNINDSSSNFNNSARASDIAFFGRFTPSLTDFETIAYDASFGPIDFEFFGNRQSIMLNFINRGNNNFYYFDSLQNILDKFETPTLYQGKDLWYKKILYLDVSNNSYLYVKEPIQNGDKMLIMTAEDINTVVNKFNAYSISPLNISLLGINPVKDIDNAVYDSTHLNYQSEYSYNREDDVDTYQISLDACSNYTLDIQGSYIIKSGTGIFTKDGTPNTYDVSTLFNTFDSSIDFETNTDTIITYAVLDTSFAYTGYSDANVENIGSYYDSSALLKYGLTVPTVSKWVGLGTDCRNNPLLLKLNGSSFQTGMTSNFIPDASQFSQEISYPVFKYLTPGTRAWENYIFYDINDIVDSSNNLSFKDAMFAYPYVDYFSKLIYSNYNVDAAITRSSISYYNNYKDSLDVTITGLKLSLSLEYIAKQLIDLKNYNRFRFSFISTPSKNKTSKHPIEVIINENTRTILMIWYQGNDELNYTARYSSYLPGKSLLDSTNSAFVTSADPSQSYYSFVKTPFIVNNSTLAKLLINIYGKDYGYDSSVARPYAQYNKNINGISSIYNAFGANIIVDNFFYSPLTYNTFTQAPLYSYFPNSNTFSKYSINYGYKYNSNENLYISNTTNIETLKYLLTPNYDNVMYNNVMFYIIRDDDIYSSYDFGSANLMTITVNSPKSFNNISTYNGWYQPKFNNIFEFKADEEKEFIDIVDQDFILSNTNLINYNSISQLWYNKLVSNISQADLDADNAISYIKDFNVFKSQWDGDYYIKDGVPTDGYECPVELPSFFGSKLPKFPDFLVFDKWDTTTLRYSETTSEITAYYNLTKAILNTFTSSLTFLSNWSGLTSADNIINDYIKNTVLPYYGINAPKIKLDFYYTTSSSGRRSVPLNKIAYTHNSDFILDEKQNFNGQPVQINGEYYYKIIIPKTGNYSYFIKITLYEK
jgi:hypothetical protein